jgi:hypothetical protein
MKSSRFRRLVFGGLVLAISVVPTTWPPLVSLPFSTLPRRSDRLQ